MNEKPDFEITNKTLSVLLKDPTWPYKGWSTWIECVLLFLFILFIILFIVLNTKKNKNAFVFFGLAIAVIGIYITPWIFN